MCVRISICDFDWLIDWWIGLIDRFDFFWLIGWLDRIGLIYVLIGLRIHSCVVVGIVIVIHSSLWSLALAVLLNRPFLNEPPLLPTPTPMIWWPSLIDSSWCSCTCLPMLRLLLLLLLLLLFVVVLLPSLRNRLIAKLAPASLRSWFMMQHVGFLCLVLTRSWCCYNSASSRAFLYQMRTQKSWLVSVLSMVGVKSSRSSCSIWNHKRT